MRTLAVGTGQAYSRSRARVEWPSLALAGGIYVAFVGLTWFHAALPAWLVWPALIWVVAWQSSMQHEFIHGHPTRSRRINRALASVPLSLWLPFESYRASHLVHHRDERLTDPFDDPESFYLAPEHWARLSAFGRLALRCQATLAGRMVVGPFWNAAHFTADEVGRALRGDRFLRAVWLRHGVAVALLMGWVWGVCGLDPLVYVLGVVYPATAILMVRSFAEHRAAQGPSERSAIVENAPVLGLLYLYNNLHAAHHETPLVPWYALPTWYRDNRTRLLVANGGLVYDGYGDVARRFLFTAHDSVTHPNGRVGGETSVLAD